LLQVQHEYNILQEAGNCLGFKHSEETLAKMSKAKSGKQRSIETIEKLRVPHAGQVLLKKGK
jgi:NUMOD3 motif